MGGYGPLGLSAISPLVQTLGGTPLIDNGRYFNSGGKKSGQFHELVFGVDFSHLSSIMRLPFLARRLDEIGFEASGELRESAADRQFIARRNAGIQAT